MIEEIVEDLREYLRIQSAQPDPDYDGCVTFLKKMANKIGIRCNVYGNKNKPVVVISWEGKNKNAASIMLNSHMDVVPVFPEDWKFDPFEAHMDQNGRIYARGAQDMKSVGIQHLGAIWNLKKNGFSPKRTIHVTFVPDEEIRGKDGMAAFVLTPEFKSLNVGFELDESGPSPFDSYVVFNDERSRFSFNIHCNGTTGHGSLLHESTAGEKLRFITDNLMDRREIEAAKMKNKIILELANVTSINLTKLEGGVQNNVVPPLITATFDVRLGVNEDEKKFVDWIEDLRQKAGKDVEVEYLGVEEKVPKTELDNEFVKTFQTSLQKRNIKFIMHACFGTTDARIIRKVGIPALGFSPIKNTEILIHDHNEYIDESVFLEGMRVLEDVIKDLSLV